MSVPEKQVLWLAALLHDIGKFSQRIGGEYHAKHYEFSEAFVRHLRSFLGEELSEKVAALAAGHHNPSDRYGRILQLADWLAASEREQEPRERLKSDEAALVSVASRVEFRERRGSERFFQPKRLTLERDILFSTQLSKVDPGAYGNLWDEFVERFRTLPPYQPSDFTTLYFLLREFGTFIPSATPWEQDQYQRTVPDVSLYGHSKVVCAIAACLANYSKAELPDDMIQDLLYAWRIQPDAEVVKKPLFLLVRADFSGIQSFLYRITKPTTELPETKGTAKRLRGRSFYLSLLAEVIAEWSRTQLDLPIANLLFCGGGRFDLLLPNSEDVKKRLVEVEHQIDQWLLRKFYGELGIQLGCTEVAAEDFRDFSRVYNRVEDSLADKKRRKFQTLFNEPGFFFREGESLYRVCHYCQITPMSKVAREDEPCPACREQHEMGDLLPETNFLACIYGQGKFQNADEKRPIEFGAPLGMSVFLLKDEYAARSLLQANPGHQIMLYKLNSIDDYILNRGNEPVAFGFKFLANEAPRALRDHPPIKSGKDAISTGDILDFEEIAFLSEGAKLLGVLKMDVDHLGLLLGGGIEPNTISRLSTLSGSFDLFFGGWLDEICRTVSRKWKEEHRAKGDQRWNLVDNLFYVIYSGGDDLLIIGPWDQIIELAQGIYHQFREYTCQNENITLSGGILLVKPHFPIQRFSQLVGDELDISKNGGRDRITVFQETLLWQHPERGKSFADLIEFGQKLAERVGEEKLPKSFVYFLFRLYKQHFKEEEQDLRWVPKFLYTLARRVDKEVIGDLDLQRDVPVMMGHVRIPVCYVSLITRKE